MDKVRFGVVGLGNIGRFHASNLLEGKVPRAELTAVCTRQKEPFGPGSTVQAFDGIASLLGSGLVDAVIIATPHPRHAEEGILAFQAGVHVVMEKPIAAQKADAERLIAAHQRHPETVFAAMFQFRTEPRYQKMRQLILAGDLGRLQRVTWINTDWFRPEAYYASSAWRATWKGEGGGVLINQCLHNLDTLQWLCGMPRRVRGFCQFGRHHHIEVEDEATAWFEWSGGTTGIFVGSTGEAPGTNRLEIAGTRGRLVLEQDQLTFDQTEGDVAELSAGLKDAFGTPAVGQSIIPLARRVEPHVKILRNVVDAILEGAPLIAPGVEGLHSIELANAAVYSSLLGETIELPLDGARWAARLEQLISESTHQKRVVEGAVGDVAGSFKR